jgi:hypothetical protein
MRQWASTAFSKFPASVSRIVRQRATVTLRLKNVDSEAEFRQFLPATALNAPYLPPNPHRPRAFGGKGAEGMKKEIPCSKHAASGLQAPHSSRGFVQVRLQPAPRAVRAAEGQAARPRPAGAWRLRGQAGPCRRPGARPGRAAEATRCGRGGQERRTPTDPGPSAGREPRG